MAAPAILLIRPAPTGTGPADRFPARRRRCASHGRATVPPRADPARGRTSTHRPPAAGTSTPGFATPPGSGLARVRPARPDPRTSSSAALTA
ncbi:hypothetical protein [Amycolatopsis sp. MtRt-6]|uniref:hypothetical protein n=1 Tax=Amycolatopsis sp. MtRt-6 TaxID=2792782 RepID=UPI001A8EDC49|nr:hypothetical protein [Amycolatopsis sp. MtRt-6]